MRIIKQKTLSEFCKSHADAEEALKSWYLDVSKSNWANLNELKESYPTASIIGNERVVFNIKGNRYRLIVKFTFKYQNCYIKFIGTHAEYDKIDALTVDNY